MRPERRLSGNGSPQIGTLPPYLVMGDFLCRNLAFPIGHCALQKSKRRGRPLYISH